MAPAEPERRRRHRDRDRDIGRDDERERRRERERRQRQRKSRTSPSTSGSSSQPLSVDSLAKLDRLNQRGSREAREPRHSELRPERVRRPKRREVVEEEVVVERKQRHRKKRRRREVSGALLEEGDGRTLRGLRGGRGDDYEYDEKRYDRYTNTEPIWKRHKKRFIGGIVAIVLIVIIVVVAVVVSKNKSSNSGATGSSSSGNGVSQSGVPTAARNTQMDPSIWLDVTDFNTTYTNVTVGGLPIIGLNSSWDDSQSPNDKVPAIDSAWGSYETLPARGVNLGGWLSIEPFIAPSLFNSYDSNLGIIDEYTLCKHLGTSGALATLEKHYSTFVTEQTFIDIANAGLDHVRIPFSYWAWKTFDDDPYVFRTSWRYLLRGIEWARKHGLRINLDVHGIPGSQNGWNHSGRQGNIGWLNGTNGALNAQRSLDMHDALSQFFAQDRYKNIIAFYGLVNEPKMTALNSTAVEDWSAQAFTLVRKNGITAYVVIGDGFRGLENWQGQLQGYTNLLLDVHQYVIFNTGQIVYNHTQKVNYACTGWTQQAEQSMNVATGFGPTIFAEWSQADTDCATYLNNVGWGNRWTGTYTTGNPLTQVLSPTCPVTTGCDCTQANADPSTYSTEYKTFLQMFAEAQMTSFEKGLGWFYWTWKTESAPQWSYESGLAAGILPSKAYARDFNCTQTVPNFKAAGLAENYRRGNGIGDLIGSGEDMEIGGIYAGRGAV